MPSVYKEDMRHSLEEQGFRIEDIDGQTWQVLAPVDTDLSKLTNPSGIVRIHTNGFGKENSAFIAILSELRKIGYDPSYVRTKLKGQAPVDLETQTGLEEYHREAPADDPDDRWVPLDEAAEIVGISPSGVQQRINVGKLRGVKLPRQLHERGGRVRTVQSVHVHVKELKDSGGRQRGGRSSTPHSPVKSRFDTTSSAGRLSEAASRARSAMRKIEQGMTELKEASEVIDKESGDALQELRDLRQRQREVEKAAERFISKL